MMVKKAIVLVIGFFCCWFTCYPNNKEIELKIRFTPEQMVIFDDWLSKRAEFVKEVDQEDRYLNISPAKVGRSNYFLSFQEGGEGDNVFLCKGSKVERSVKLENLEIFGQILKGIGCTETSVGDIKRYRFPKKALKGFLFKRDGWWDALKTLRIRFAGGKAKVCLKIRHVNDETGETRSRDEYETAVSNGTILLAMCERLGIIEKTVVSKKRKVYRYRNLEIGVDTVDELGSFVEVENTEERDSVERGMSAIRAFLREVGIDRCTICDRGYMHMRLNKGNLFEKELVIE